MSGTRNTRSRERRWERDASGRLSSVNRERERNSDNDTDRDRSRSRSRNRNRNTNTNSNTNNNNNSNDTDNTNSNNQFRSQVLRNLEETIQRLSGMGGDGDNNSNNSILETLRNIQNNGSFSSMLDRLAETMGPDIDEFGEIEEATNAVPGRNLNDLETVLNGIRSVLYEMGNDINCNSFTLKLKANVNGIVTIFDNIEVTKMELASPRKISDNENNININNDGFECGICIEHFKTNDNVTTLDCNHEFHTECVCDWIRQKGKCPMCRGKVIQFKCQSECGVVYI